METAAEHSGFVWSITKWVVVALGTTAPIVFGLLQLRGGLDLTNNQEIWFYRLIIGAAVTAAIAAGLHGMHRVITDSQIELLDKGKLTERGKSLGDGSTKVVLILQIVTVLTFVACLVSVFAVLLTPHHNERMVAGQSIRADDVKVTLDDARIVRSTESARPKPDKVFLAVHLSFENISNEQTTVSDVLDLTLRDAQGHSIPQLSQDEERQLVEKPLNERSLQPDISMNGAAVYQVPCDTQGLRLEYKPFNEAVTYTWLIGDAGRGVC